MDTPFSRYYGNNLRPASCRWMLTCPHIISPRYAGAFMQRSEYKLPM